MGSVGLGEKGLRMAVGFGLLGDFEEVLREQGFALDWMLSGSR